ncbi:Crp/Fnr family transcriptional regulator [Siphonobacter curvatus]|uniref:Crp/Fnr family transcriptional regulator n=1 Tax=Siphonobacter curvatus TaxID=2094562 RepID=A0A2S7IF94_9BACT|nr:Crp/Fnr family transcriptional regulator [Siphonobacter curvatus]PQA53221.1 hypothetical protein C5O19_25160 [Siphonobacter curvatus]
MITLATYLNQLQPLSAGFWQQIQVMAHIQHYPAGHQLAYPGYARSQLYFVEEGLIKVYTYDEETGLPAIHHFFQAGDFIIWPASHPTFQSNALYVECLEPSHLVGFSYQALHDTILHSSEALDLAHRIIGDILRTLEFRTQLLTQSTAGRYQHFCQRFPCHRLKNIDIASYLHLSVSTISRLRSRI